MGESDEVTRRMMLGRAAAAGAATLIVPGVAAASQSSPRISTRALGALTGQSGEIPAPPGAVVVGVQWEAPRHPRLELRVMRAAGRWGPWVSAASQGHSPDGHGSDRFGEPLWIGRASAVQVRSRGPTGGIRLHFVAGSGSPAGEAAAAFPLAQPVLDAGPGQPPIIARRGWAQGHAPPAHLAGYGTILVAFVHHTVNPNGYSAADVPGMLRAIFDYHRYVRGMLDIAYNFLIDAYGRIWEGRAGGIDMAVIGAHAGAYNAESTGVAILGDFTDVVPSTAALSALKRFLAWKLSLHGVPTYGKATVTVDPADAFYTPFRPGARVPLPRVAGHRDGDLTDCPGNALYGRLPTIREHVRALAGKPAVVSSKAPTAPVTAFEPFALTGGLSALGGAPLANAPIELQQLNFDAAAARQSTQILATAQTASDGSWTASISLAHDAIVRAVHAVAPATVADWAQVQVAPEIELTVASTSPLDVTGTIRPDKPRITVDLYQAGQTQQPMAKRKVGVSQGSFQAGFGMISPGDYTLVGRVAATNTNAGGASQPVSVTVD